MADPTRNAHERADDEAVPTRGSRVLSLPARQRGVSAMHVLVAAMAMACGAATIFRIVYTTSANMLPQARHDVLVFADSGVSVTPDYLRKVIGELQKPGVGLVTCIYRGKPEPGFWPHLSAKATNYEFLPGVVIALALGLARPCFG